MEKSASQTQLIVNMFLAPKNQKQSTFLVQTLFLLVIKKVKIKFKLQVQVTHNSRELLCLQTTYVEKYGQELSLKSRYICQH